MTRNAPEFRPRRKKTAPSSRNPWLLPIAATAIALAAIGVAIGIFFATGDDEDELANPLSTAESKSTAGTLGGPSPLLAAPAVRFLLHTVDLPRGYEAFPPETYLLSVTGFATNGLFTNVEEGERLAKEWGYVDGYQGSHEPDGALAGVLQGRFYIRVESYLFEAVTGAEQAYNYIESFHAKRPGSQRQDAKGLANQSSAWKFTQGTVGTSEMVGVFHRFIFRRGNLVSIVQTFGGEPFMNIDQARDLAVLVDQKALGERPAVTPTPGRSSIPVVPTPTR